MVFPWHWDIVIRGLDCTCVVISVEAERPVTDCVYSSKTTSYLYSAMARDCLLTAVNKATPRLLLTFNK